MEGRGRCVMIKVFIIDYPIYRLGLKTTLQNCPEFEVVGESTKAADALERIKDLQPDIVIMDAYAVNGEGVQAITMVRDVSPRTKVLVLTQSDKEEDFYQTIKSGAKGYLMKSLETEELLDSIRVVASGSAVVYTARAAKEWNGNEQKRLEANHGNSLSQREKEILRLVARGVGTREIAESLFVSQTTIKAHLRRIAEKLRAKNRAEAVAKASEMNILKEG